MKKIAVLVLSLMMIVSIPLNALACMDCMESYVGKWRACLLEIDNTLIDSESTGVVMYLYLLPSGMAIIQSNDFTDFYSWETFTDCLFVGDMALFPSTDGLLYAEFDGYTLYFCLEDSGMVEMPA